MMRRVTNIYKGRSLRQMPAAGLLLLVGVISLIIGLLWVGVASWLQQQLGLSAGQWARLETLTSVAAFAVALGTGVLVLRELAETESGRNLDVYRDLYERLMSPEAIEARRYLYTRLPLDDGGQVEVEAVLADDEARRRVKEVLNLLDYFGFLAQRDWVTEEAVIGWLSPVVVKVWARIGPLVAYECAQRPEEPDYYRAARQLAAQCQAWRDAHFPTGEPITFDERRL